MTKIRSGTFLRNVIVFQVSRAKIRCEMRNVKEQPKNFFVHVVIFWVVASYRVYCTIQKTKTSIFITVKTPNLVSVHKALIFMYFVVHCFSKLCFVFLIIC